MTLRSSIVAVAFGLVAGLAACDPGAPGLSEAGYPGYKAEATPPRDLLYPALPPAQAARADEPPGPLPAATPAPDLEAR